MEKWLEKIYKAICALAPVPSQKIVVTDMSTLTDAQLDALNPGDVVLKKTGTATHTYIVTYKDAESGGICITYTAAGYGETVSYDHSASGWTFNSIDVKTYGD